MTVTQPPGTGSVRSGMPPRTRDPRTLVAKGLAAAVGVLVLAGLLLPLVSIVLESRSTPLLSAYTDQLTSSVFLDVLRRSLVLALVATVLTLVLGFPVAYALTLTKGKLRVVLLVVLLVPQVSSLLVRTYSWIGLLGARGPVVGILNDLGFDTGSLVGSAPAVLFVLLHYFLPFMVLTVWASMRTIKPDQVRAAMSLGANRLEAFWGVYAPQALPGVVAGCLFVFVITVAMFSIPSLIGGADQTTVSMLVVQQTVTGFGTDTATPAAQATILMLIVLPIVAIALRLVGMKTLVGVATSASAPKRRSATGAIKTRPFRRVLTKVPDGPFVTHVTVTVATLVALLIIIAPFVYLILISFQPLPILAAPSGDFSTRWYSRVLSDPTWLSVGLESLRISAVATVLSLAIGWAMASITVRSSPRVGALMMGLACIPMVIPAVTYGQGYFSVFASLGLVGSWIAIGCVHAVLVLPYTYINLVSGFSAYDSRLDDAAASLGSSRWRALRTVKVPILKQFVVTGAMLAFLFSFDEFTVTRFLTGISFETLPVKFYGAAQQNLSPELAAVGSLLVFGVLLITALVALLTLRNPVTTQPKDDHELA